MGFQDRPYNRASFGGGGGYGGGGGMASMGLPKPGPAVGGLLIVNLIVFVFQALSGDLRPGQIGPMTQFFAVVPAEWWQLWRYVTFQFLHGSVFHILFNMIGLYFLGLYLEKAWGPARFLRFYLVCGAFSGLCHVLLITLTGQPNWIPLIGASGGVYAVIIACAILFPHIRLIVMFFPMPIRVAALLFFVITGLSLLSGQGGAVSHAAHFGGMVAGAFWVYIVPRIRESAADARSQVNKGAWERKMRQQADEQQQIDRILDKIQRQGIASLSEKEKRILKDATDKQRRREQGR